MTHTTYVNGEILNQRAQGAQEFCNSKVEIPKVAEDLIKRYTSFIDDYERNLSELRQKLHNIKNIEEDRVPDLGVKQTDDSFTGIFDRLNNSLLENNRRFTELLNHLNTII